MRDVVCTVCDLEFGGRPPPVVAPAGDDGPQNRTWEFDGVNQVLIHIADELSESNPFGVDHQAEPAFFAFDLDDHEVVANQSRQGVGYGAAAGATRRYPRRMEAGRRDTTSFGHFCEFDRSATPPTPQNRLMVTSEN